MQLALQIKKQLNICIYFCINYLSRLPYVNYNILYCIFNYLSRLPYVNYNILYCIKND